MTEASLAREDKDELLKRFINVTKADCEMNLYLVRARHGPQLSLMPCMWNVFHSCIRSWKAPETEESKAAKAAERAEKARKKKNKDKENKEKSDKEGVKSEEESDQPILGCSWVGTCCLGIWFCLPVK